MSASSPASSGRPCAARQFNPARHFALLCATAGLLVMMGPWRIAPGLGPEFALYGALHACSLAVSVCGRHALPRQLLFAAAAALLSLLTVRLGLSALGWVAQLSLGAGAGLAAILMASSALGALAYGTLVGRFLNFRWPRGALAMTSLACALAAAAAFIVCRRYPVARGWWLAIPWWYAFSGGLWCAHSRADGKA
jgi:hypothetical protein